MHCARKQAVGRPQAPDTKLWGAPNISATQTFTLSYGFVMWWSCLILLSVAWARKLDKPVNPPVNAAASGGLPGDLEAPLPAEHHGSDPPEVIPILSYDFQPNTGDGSYSFSYETGNGIRVQEEGVLKNEVPEGPGEAVHGIYSYTGPDGVVYTVAYTADENGFVAKGDHLPTPPPIPAEIQAAIDQNAAEEAAAAAQEHAPGEVQSHAPIIRAEVPALGTPGPPAQIGYFKHYPSNYYNRHHNNYFRRY